MNGVSFVTPGFERYIVASVRQALPNIADASVREEADIFLRQEAIHARAHRNHAEALIRQYPGLSEIAATIDSSYEQLLESRPLHFHLAYVADIEATFTPMYDMYLRHRGTLLDNGDHSVAPLFLWHFVEEIEHRSSALTIYNAVVRSPWYRLSVAPLVFAHIRKVQQIALEGFMLHVPAADRGLDFAELPFWRQLHNWVFNSETKQGALLGVSRAERLQTLYRLARSQLPGHSPASERTPPFAETWLDAYAAGQDVVNWYERA
jgi:predicted metal-dependent hydrolase